MVQHSVNNSSSIHNSPSFNSSQPTRTEHFRPNNLSEALKAIQGLGLKIEVCGSWLWVFGAKATQAAKLRAAGLQWSSPKGCWYWCPPGKDKRPDHQPWSLDKIRETYRSQRVQG